MTKYLTAALSAFKSIESGAWQSIAGKALYVVAGWALTALHAKYPELPLPGVDSVVTAIYGIGAAHTASDFFTLASQFLAAYSTAAKGGGATVTVLPSTRTPADGPCPTCGSVAK